MKKAFLVVGAVLLVAGCGGRKEEVKDVPKESRKSELKEKTQGGPVDEPIIISSSAPSFTIKNLLAAIYVYGVHTDGGRRVPGLWSDVVNGQTRVRFRRQEPVSYVCFSGGGQAKECVNVSSTNWLVTLVFTGGRDLEVQPHPQRSNWVQFNGDHSYNIPDSIVQSDGQLTTVKLNGVDKGSRDVCLGLSGLVDGKTPCEM